MPFTSRLFVAPGSPATTDRPFAHVTLAFLGDSIATADDTLRDAVEAAANECAPFEGIITGIKKVGKNNDMLAYEVELTGGALAVAQKMWDEEGCLEGWQVEAGLQKQLFATQDIGEDGYRQVHHITMGALTDELHSRMESSVGTTVQFTKADIKQTGPHDPVMTVDLSGPESK